MDNYQNYNLNTNTNNNNNNFLPLLESTPQNNNNNQSLIKGFSNDIHENLFAQDINEKLPIYGQGILNEDIFKNRKFSELKKNKKLKSSNEGINNINGLVNIMNDKNWGHENKTRGITSEATTSNYHGKIYRELGK